MKGPNGMASFLPFILDNNKNMDMIAPMKKDKSIQSIVCCQPNMKPKAAISLISPPPIPPLETTAIKMKRSPAPAKPFMLATRFNGKLYVYLRKTLYKTAAIKIAAIKELGIIR